MYGRIAVICLLIGLLLGWLVNGWRWESRYLALQTEHAQAIAKQASEAQVRLQAEQARIAAIDAKYNEELSHAKSEAYKLHADLGAGRVRLYIPAKCAPVPTGSNTGPTSPEARAELDPTTAQFLAGIAGEGDDAIRQLDALIDACR